MRSIFLNLLHRFSLLSNSIRTFDSSVRLTSFRMIKLNNIGDKPATNKNEHVIINTMRNAINEAIFNKCTSETNQTLNLQFNNFLSEYVKAGVEYKPIINDKAKDKAEIKYESEIKSEFEQRCNSEIKDDAEIKDASEIKNDSEIKDDAGMKNKTEMEDKIKTESKPKVTPEDILRMSITQYYASLISKVLDDEITTQIDIENEKRDKNHSFPKKEYEKELARIKKRIFMYFLSEYDPVFAERKLKDIETRINANILQTYLLNKLKCMDREREATDMILTNKRLYNDVLIGNELNKTPFYPKEEKQTLKMRFHKESKYAVNKKITEHFTVIRMIPKTKDGENISLELIRSKVKKDIESYILNVNLKDVWL